jgi:hypothetical protein
MTFTNYGHLSNDIQSAIFKDFIYSFQFQLYYKGNESKLSRLIFILLWITIILIYYHIFDYILEFIDESREIYNALEKAFKSQNSYSIENFYEKFYLSLIESLNQVNYSYPNKATISEVIHSDVKLNGFYDFLNKLSINSKLIHGIGLFKFFYFAKTI